MPEEKVEKWKENKLNYIKSYNKKTYYQFPITFHKEKDKDLIEFFSMVPHKNKYIKNLIREDLRRFKSQEKGT